MSISRLAAIAMTLFTVSVASAGEADLVVRPTTPAGQVAPCPRPDIRWWPREVGESFTVTRRNDGALLVADGGGAGKTFVLRCGQTISEPFAATKSTCPEVQTVVMRPAAPVRLNLVPEKGAALPAMVKLDLRRTPPSSGNGPQELVYRAAPGKHGLVSTTLPAGRWDLTVLSKDFAPVTLWGTMLKPGVAFGPVTLRLKRGASVLVHALDSEDGLGVAGAKVCLVTREAFEKAFRTMTEGRPPAGARCATTNREGWLRLAGLRAGTFFLVSLAPKHSVGCRQVALSSRAETVVDDLEIPRPATVFLSLSGRSGLPAGAKLSVDAIPEVCGQTLVDLTRYVAVPPDGEVSMDGLPPGRLHLEATLITPGGLAATVAREALDLLPGDIRSVSLDLSGTLYHGSVSFREEPIHASLAFMTPGKASGDHGVAESDDGGDFAVFLRRPGTYDVRVLAERPRLDTIVPGVEVSDPKTPVEISVPDTAIRGLVVDADGQPVAQAKVSGTSLPAVTDSSGPSALRPLLTESRSAEDGSLALEGLAPGRWTVTAASGDRRSDPRQLTVTKGQSIENVILTLKEVLAIEGRVATDHGTPVAGAHVIVSPGHGRIESAVAVTDAGGRFTLSVNAEAGMRANVEVVGGDAASWCGRLALAKTMHVVLPAQGGTVLLSGDPKGLLETPTHVALIRPDGSFVGVMELLAYGGASLSRTARGTVLRIPALAAGQWRLVTVASPTAILRVIDSFGLQLPVAARLTLAPGATVTIPLPEGRGAP